MNPVALWWAHGGLAAVGLSCGPLESHHDSVNGRKIVVIEYLNKVKVITEAYETYEAYRNPCYMW
jgi:hypothetical protein